MYHQYFGLSESPFSIAVNPRYLFMSGRHRDALAHLLYGVGAGGGFILLTGEVGTGKTTINRCLLAQLPQDTDVAMILNPTLNSQELLATACDEFGIDYEGHQPTLKTLTDKLHAFLLENHRKGRNTVLMIDEAQHLDFEVLEQIRLLTNLETNTRKLLQIILIGQPELVTLLNQPELRQLNQRITARYNLEPLNLAETRAYIRHRLQVAGLPAGRELFPAAVSRGIYRHTRGIPRLINVLCDRILLGTYGRNKTRADRTVLRSAVKEVMGQEPALEQRGSTLARFFLPVGACLGLLAAVTAWQLGVLPSVPAELPGPTVTASAPQNTLPQTAANQSAPAPKPLESVSLSEHDQDEGGQAAWLLPPEQATRELWRLTTGAAEPSSSCPKTPVSGVMCGRGQAQTWDQLRGFDRPFALEIVTPDRFGASALLLGFEGAAAYVATESGVERVALRQLAPLWSGAYQYLWHAPPGFEGPVRLGDEGPVVARVAALFATLDEQPQALTNKQFNRALKERVQLFQTQHELNADGVVGVLTLLKLNEILGIDPGTRELRARVNADSAEFVQR